MSDAIIVSAPPMAAKAPFLKDADGNLYLWSPELAARGDLVAAFDPKKPDAHAADFSQITLNRELELARDKAQMEEAHRLEAEKAKIEAEKAKKEAEEVASANAETLRKTQTELERVQAAHAKEMAEMQAKLDAMANSQVKEKVKEKVKAKVKAKVKEAENPQVVNSEENQEQDDDVTDFA